MVDFMLQHSLLYFYLLILDLLLLVYFVLVCFYYSLRKLKFLLNESVLTYQLPSQATLNVQIGVPWPRGTRMKSILFLQWRYFTDSQLFSFSYFCLPNILLVAVTGSFSWWYRLKTNKQNLPQFQDTCLQSDLVQVRKGNLF